MRKLSFLILLFAVRAYAANIDNPIDLKDGKQIHAEYFAHGTAKGTLVFLSGDGYEAGSGFDPEFASKCETFQNAGWNVIAVHSIRWLRALHRRNRKSKHCLDLSLEIKKYVGPLAAQMSSPKNCLTLVGYSYGTTLGTAAYAQDPSNWCGLSTLSWCNAVYLEAFSAHDKLCKPSGGDFTYNRYDGLLLLKQYSGQKKSLLVQGRNDVTCNYSDTDAYLLSTNGDLQDSNKYSLHRITVENANHDLRLQDGSYPWIKDFLKWAIKLSTTY